MLLTTQGFHRAITALAFAAPLAIPLPSQAAGDLMFLRNSPATKFVEADFALLGKSIDHALAGPVDGAEQAWKNEQTGASGTVTPQPTQGPSSGQECRRLKIANAYKHMKDEGIYTFCRASTGDKWQLRP